MGAVSIKELAANSGSCWMSQAPNLHFAMQLFIAQFLCIIHKVIGRCSGLSFSALDSGQSGLRSSPGRGYCVVIIGKETLLSQRLSPPR